jgi:hypothetical protein
LDLSQQQHQLIKDMSSELIQMFEVPYQFLALPRVVEKVRLMMKTRDHKIFFDSMSQNHELMYHLNNCREDLYKQIFFK